MTEDKLILPLDRSEQEALARRTFEERERDRVMIARMYVRGKSQHEMLAVINAMYPDRLLNIQAIQNDLKYIRSEWQK